MHKGHFYLLFCAAGLLFVPQALLAQCESCAVPSDYKAQYCYQEAAFEKFCAAFNEEQKYFCLYNGKKTQQIPDGERDAAYFANLAQDRSLKLDAEALLFIQNALARWEIESRKIGYTFRPSGLGIKIVSEGTGDFPEAKKNVRVHYAGYLEDGTKFDSSYDRNEPIEFPLGMGRVIKGWDEGIAALRRGTKAWLYIPSDIAYGAADKGSIPPNSTLIFQVEVLE